MKKIAVITGASSGIGREFVMQTARLYRNLDEIWVIARREEQLFALRKSVSIPVRPLPLDLSDRASDLSLKERLSEEKPQIRLLVNAAGYGMIGKAEELDAEGETGMIDVNCRALTAVTLAVLPFMVPGSRIIEVASAAAFLPQPNFAVYAATKAYVYSFSRALGEELGKRRISVTAVCPGPVRTPFFSPDAPASHKDRFMAEPEKVVRRALTDAVNRRPVSVYGAAMKTGVFLSRFLPHGPVCRFFNRHSI